MTAAAIQNPEILVWARERAGLATDALAQKLKIKPQRLQQWESGAERPSFVQARNLAKATHLPFGYLFLSRPPNEELPLPDLRTVGDQPLNQYSLDLLDTIKLCLLRQDWYHDYQIEQQHSPVAIVGQASVDQPAPLVAKRIREVMRWPEFPRKGNADDYFRNLIAAIEATGVLVMRSGQVGSNTHRLLRVDEFRGFAIADSHAPLIFINGADANGAKLFTLVHELAHVWLGKSGVSDGKPDAERQEERWCNAVAAEFLVPETVFTARWDADVPWREMSSMLARDFHVSQWVIVRRAYEFGLVSKDEHDEYLREQLHLRRNQKGGSPNYNVVQLGKVSKPLAQAVAIEALNGKMLLSEAHQLIGIKPHKLKAFAQGLGL
jgi:Zn-dependent peptidase ImmA (M78 family)/DNA-binding XRE family transcriptional regulator